jgi:hypothetical protein
LIDPIGIGSPVAGFPLLRPQLGLAEAVATQLSRASVIAARSDIYLRLTIDPSP